MKAEEYQNMAALDQTHWYFLGMGDIMVAVLDHVCRGARDLNILEAGLGTCWFTRYLSKYGNVTALDISTDALTVCKERGITRLIQADVANIPSKDAEFDLIVCSEVLYHQYVKDDNAVMKEFCRVLKPGGRALVKVPAHMYLWGKHDTMNLTGRRYERRDLQRIFRDNGFTIERTTYANFFLFPIVYLKRKMELRSKGDAESDLKEMPSFINSLLLMVLRLEAVLLRYINLPQGSTLICVGVKK